MTQRLNPAILILAAALAINAVPVQANLGSQKLGTGGMQISDAGPMPDSPFYFMKRFGESLQLFFTFDNSAKQALRMKFATTRLAEAQSMVNANEMDKAEKALSDYGKEIEGVNNTSFERENSRVLESVLQKVPASAMPSIERALNTSADQRYCVQVITSARDPATNETREFPTPCDVPAGWIKTGMMAENDHGPRVRIRITQKSHEAESNDNANFSERNETSVNTSGLNAENNDEKSAGRIMEENSTAK